MIVEILGYDVELEEELSTASRQAIRTQVEQYETGDRRSFDVPVTVPENHTGAVMTELLSIPFGETRTYEEVAQRVGSAPIAVGQACGRNPIPIVVPCHRVVRADGIGGFAYPGLKERLLKLETENVRPVDRRRDLGSAGASEIRHNEW